jgi:hypothetical protein
MLLERFALRRGEQNEEEDSHPSQALAVEHGSGMTHLYLVVDA